MFLSLIILAAKSLFCLCFDTFFRVNFSQVLQSSSLSALINLLLSYVFYLVAYPPALRGGFAIVVWRWLRWLPRQLRLLFQPSLSAFYFVDFEVVLRWGLYFLKCYKRCSYTQLYFHYPYCAICVSHMLLTFPRYPFSAIPPTPTTVSYTHLTLPTKRIVQISVVARSLQKKKRITKKTFDAATKHNQLIYAQPESEGT
eukprot:TRINITY_DN25342_c0_g1_i1.p1 TRINITY_DN25342_c0_g1~~TRINITY_DN25342_c0_g1_i1.p1  ORF type:complete len:199 (-),score=-5.17 TRINITY_DN25342_c0_g1_i1:10-606(-)